LETVLIADDDPSIRKILCYGLNEAGFKTVEAADGPEALAKVRELEPDLLLLDFQMPGMDGDDVCREIRRTSSIPIIFLSGVKKEEIDRVIGLELGGDDYVTKPFSVRELVLRVKAILRRSSTRGNEIPDSTAPKKNELAHGRIRMDLARKTVFWDDTEVSLPVTGFNILKAMMSNDDRVFEAHELRDHAYDDNRYVEIKTIIGHIRTIRERFSESGGEDPIETKRGHGYIMARCD
jgi:two-component system OmpR family response regulator